METKPSQIKVKSNNPQNVPPTKEECFAWLAAYGNALQINENDVAGQWGASLAEETEWKKWKFNAKSTKVTFEACSYLFRKNANNNVISSGEFE